MTIGKCIRLSGEIKKNNLSRELLVNYISQCEAIIQTEVMLLPPDRIRSYPVNVSDEAELLALPPYDRLYLEYLVAMIDFSNGETNKYRNSIDIFRDDLASFSAYYFNSFHPADIPISQRKAYYYAD